mmetsp:Transcript_99234/g.280222  ORF Transcript_99234/g.280222 Transcript_99234/m.280222 type:complete len:179 (-) Transcript_99234:127-663(-)
MIGVLAWAAGLGFGIVIGVYQEERVRPFLDYYLSKCHANVHGYLDSALGGVGILTVRIIAAYNLMNVDGAGDLSDPFAKIKAPSGKVYTTDTVSNCLNPVWKRGGPWSFEVNTSDATETNVLTIEVFDSNTFKRNELLGTVTIPLSRIPIGRRRKLLVGGQGGELEYELSFQRPRPRR